jgi:hypothetical protein
VASCTPCDRSSTKLLAGPACRRYASAKVVQVLFRDIDVEGADCSLFANWIGHGGLLSVNCASADHVTGQHTLRIRAGIRYICPDTSHTTSENTPQTKFREPLLRGRMNEDYGGGRIPSHPQGREGRHVPSPKVYPPAHLTWESVVKRINSPDDGKKLLLGEPGRIRRIYRQNATLHGILKASYQQALARGSDDRDAAIVHEPLGEQ